MANQLRRALLISLTCLLPHAARSQVVINEVMSFNCETLLDEEGKPSDWIELYNAGAVAVDLEGHGLSDRDDDLLKWVFPSVVIPAGGHLVVFASGEDRVIPPDLHANFKVDADGEIVALSSPQGVVLDVVSVPPLPCDIAVGRFPDGAAGLSIHDPATPGQPNGAPAFSHVSGEAVLSHPGGYHDDAIELTITTDEPGASIRYTLDGSEPTPSSGLYDGPVTIARTTVLRARVVEPDALPGPVTTRTFLIDESFELPVVSISTNPEYFFDEQIGIYAFGRNFESSFPHFGANFWQDWERPVHLEFYEPDGALGFSAGAGAKIFGGWSRGHPQRSLSFFARKKYGERKFRYRIFPGKKIDSFEAFNLRNSGNDWQRTHFRDAMMTSLLDDLEVDRQAYRPAVVFINARYWGIMNLREKVNEHFLESNHEDEGVDSEQVDLLERNRRVIHGDAIHYNSLLRLISRNDVSDPAVYEEVKGLIDVENFIDYQASQIYFDNRDWPGNNIKYWRPRTADGRWRWILYDTDFGFGIWNAGAYASNTLSFALEPSGPNWPNPPWSTLLLRRLVTNDEFVEEFLNRFATHLSTIFRPTKVIRRIDEIAAALEADMPAHKARWGGSVNDWRSQVQVTRNFAGQRVRHMQNHLMARFGLRGTSVLRLDVSPPGGGVVAIHGIDIPDYPWAGMYFLDVPVRIAARPHPGYRFAGWTNVEPSGQPQSSITLTGASLEVSATFEIDCTAVDAVVINEINYNAPVEQDPGDWVEIHNQSAAEIDVGGWSLRDRLDSHEFRIPPETRIPAHGYLVLCSDTAAFTTRFPQVDNYLGDLGFSLEGSGERVELRDATGNRVDIVVYGDESPWPEEADGQGATLALKNPILGNTFPLHWAASSGGGTPGARNDVFEVVESECAISGVRFVRGDCNRDGAVDLGDAVCTLMGLFRGRPIDCLAAVDANGDRLADTSDAVHLLTYLFLNGPPPAAPFPACSALDAADGPCEAPPGGCTS